MEKLKIMEKKFIVKPQLDSEPSARNVEILFFHCQLLHFFQMLQQGILKGEVLLYH
jgi:hypothetical protein